MSLRNRCRELYGRMSRDAMLRQGDPVETLVAFVTAEIGRTADARLDQTLPLCLYFSTVEDRAEFIEAVREAKPGMVMKEMP